MTTQQAAERIYDALEAALERDSERATEIVIELAKDSDVMRMYGICKGIAEAGHKALRTIHGERAPDLARGDFWQIAQLEPGALDDPPHAFASWFIVAHCNDDKAMTLAHYETLLALGPDTFLRGICQLLADVAGLTRTALEHQERQER